MQGRSVLITGGTGGLGPAVVRAAQERGGRVTATYRNDAELERAKAAFTQAEFEAIAFVRADVTVEGEVARLFAAGTFEVVLHLVGGYATGPTSAQTLEAWNAMMAINLTSAFLVCKHAIEPMRARDYGRIVTVGARTALEPTAGAAAYAASKAGVVALTRVVADELRGTGATANCVLPSLIDTPTNRQALPKADPSRWVTPASLAGVIAFLGSEAARDLRGAAIPVYGSL